MGVALRDAEPRQRRIGETWSAIRTCAWHYCSFLSWVHSLRWGTCFFSFFYFISGAQFQRGMNWVLLLSKLIAGTAALYLFWLIVQCPCKRLLCCHLPNAWITLAVLVGVVLAVNGLRWSDARCMIR